MAEKAADLITREEQIAQAKELYSRGSRNFLVKAYEEAADDLSQVCQLYSSLYGEKSNELGMPYLLYAKSLVALALDENKVVDVPDVDENEDGDEDAQNDEISDDNAKEDNEKKENKEAKDPKPSTSDNDSKKITESDSVDEKPDVSKDGLNLSKTNGAKEAKPGTSNGSVVTEENTIAEENEEDVDNAEYNLQVAWETLELAAQIFQNQDESALPNLAEVYTELANISFENNNMQAARDDYNKALNVYKDLSSSYRRAMAEIYYKIGLSYLMEQQSRESADSLTQACDILGEEINELKNKEDQTEEDKLNLQDMEETKQEIKVKISEIEESMQQCISEVRTVIKKYLNPNPECGESSSAVGSSEGSSLSSAEKTKPTDISHLIKRKKPDSASPVDNEMSPAKRPAT